MRPLPATLLSRLTREIARFVSGLASYFRNLAHDMSTGYRPELCYMRGPGPKSRVGRQRR